MNMNAINELYIFSISSVMSLTLLDNNYRQAIRKKENIKCIRYFKLSDFDILDILSQTYDVITSDILRDEFNEKIKLCL